MSKYSTYLQQFSFEPYQKIHHRLCRIECDQCKQRAGDHVDNIMVTQIDGRKNQSAAEKENDPTRPRFIPETENHAEQRDLRMPAREYIARHGLRSLCACHTGMDILRKINEPSHRFGK